EPEEWWNAVQRTTRRLMEQTGVSPQDVLCITYGAQMLGIVPVDSEGRHLRQAIIWLDNRACKQAQGMMRKFLHPRLFALVAGATLCGKDCVPKLLWLKAEEPEIYNRMRCFLDVNGYLIFRTTGNIVMDWSCASVFGIDLKKKNWLKGVFRYIGLDPEKCPPLVRSTDQVGVVSAEAARGLGLLEGTPVIAGAGDAACAAVGSGAVGEGEGHVYIGTSGWVGVVTERTPRGKCGAATIHSADPAKAFLIAETETAGACLQWIGDELYRMEKTDPNISNIFSLMDEAVTYVSPGANHLIFTPWLYGERAPIADCNVRSSFLNLSADHTRENMLRAVYEGVAYNFRWLVDIVDRQFNFPLPKLRVIGGGAKSEPWMQILSDVTQRQVETVHNPQEAGAVGVALIAAIGLGIYPNFEALKDVVKVEKVFEPQEENRDIYDSLFQSYQESYRSLRNFYKKLNRIKLSQARQCREVTK
ncbi:MAG: FGGY-family carbohydrate kinase, partial [Dehalococcoidia bacterium]